MRSSVRFAHAQWNLLMAAFSEKPVRNAMDSCRDMPLHAPPGVAMVDPNTSTISWGPRQLRQLHHFEWRDPKTTKVPVDQCDCRSDGPAEAVLAGSVQSVASEGEKEAAGQAPSGPTALCCHISTGVEWRLCPWYREMWGGRASEG